MKQKRVKCLKRRQEENLRLADLATTMDKELFPNALKLKSSLYLWIILLMGVFYTLPVLQLILTDQKEMNAGNQDICYFNFLCKVSALHILDFGSFFSNISYVISGIFFILISHLRNRRYRAYLATMPEGLTLPEKRAWKRRGIPEQYGIFYAMGGALAMEGVLSACYHICPTKVRK